MESLSKSPHDSLRRSTYKDCVDEWKHAVNHDIIRTEERVVAAQNTDALYNYVYKRTTIIIVELVLFWTKMAYLLPTTKLRHMFLTITSLLSVLQITALCHVVILLHCILFYIVLKSVPLM